MYEQAKILSVNSHKEVRWLKVRAKDMTTAMNKMCGVLRDNSLPWPQILDSQQRSQDEWALLVTGPLETLQAIENFLKNSGEMKIENEELSTVTVTCQGSFASDLPEKMIHALSEEKLIARKMLFSAMSLTVLVSAKDRDATVRVLHGLRV